jgi:signal transduction histidine kinase
VTLRAKLLTIVGAAALGLVLVAVLTALIGRRETRELTALEGRLLPRLALGPRLEGDFENLGRSMQDAVAAQDRQALDETNSIRVRLFTRIADAPGAVSAAQAAEIREKVDDYYQSAQNLSRRLIDQESGEAMMGAMASMQAKRADAADAITQATSLDYKQLSEHFQAIAAARGAASRLRLGVSCACFVLVLFLSIKVSRGVLSVVRDLSLGFTRFGQGDFRQPIPVTAKDEVGQLSARANEMADHLRTTLARLADTSADLARANGELEAFSYSVAHDLRAPLRAINGYCTAIIEDVGDKLPSEPKRYLERAAAAAERLGHLIDALLSLSRVSRTAFERVPVDLTAVAETVIAQLRASAPDRRVSFTAAPHIVANGDPTLLRALLENLLGNAWKFTSKSESARIELGRTQHEGVTALFVRDNGAGFDMEYAGRLFAPFQRLHSAEDFAGTGIGLATVQRIVRRHGGTIWAEGAVGRGATMFFTLEPGTGGKT